MISEGLVDRNVQSLGGTSWDLRIGRKFGDIPNASDEGVRHGIWIILDMHPYLCPELDKGEEVEVIESWWSL